MIRFVTVFWQLRQRASGQPGDCLPSISQGGETSSPNPLFNHPQIPSSIFRSLSRFKIKFIFSCSAWVCLGLDLEIYEEHLLCACWHFRVSIPRGSIHKAAVCWEAEETDWRISSHSDTAPAPWQPKQTSGDRRNLSDSSRTLHIRTQGYLKCAPCSQVHTPFCVCILDRKWEGGGWKWQAFFYILGVLLWLWGVISN